MLSVINSTLSVTDNADTTIPWFPALERANDIHLRGNIDKSVGPNIFPSLKAVPGTVTIEAWNSDFNCSKLVSQVQDSIIQHLVCNGTDNGGHGDSGAEHLKLSSIAMLTIGVTMLAQLF
ncbi:hypothetical protein F4777DRAFT_92049 [Nemania sp. FL0916]|nr:hypothetical protein F4777DRAFT_92049 [Nemania sp. FL0916]